MEVPAHTAIHLAFPPTSMERSSLDDQLSMSKDLTKLTFTPNDRCLPAHARHSRIPNDTADHCG